MNNTTPASGTVLNVLFTTDISVNFNNFSFFAGSDYITFDGSYNGLTSTVTLNTSILIYGAFSTNYRKAINVQNFIVRGVSSFFLSDFGRSSGIYTCIATNITSYLDAIGSEGIFESSGTANNGSILIRGCISNTPKSILGSSLGLNGTVVIEDCVANSLLPFGISGSGVICGANVASGGSLTIRRCVNNTPLSNIYISGICGNVAFNTNLIIENCINNTSIGVNCGGIYGTTVNSNSSVIIRNCLNTGSVIGGSGIANQQFGYNTNKTCSITNCYNTGALSGASFGICGNDAGKNDNATYSPTVNISNCYSLGNISNTGAGIIGSTTSSTNAPTINISNCYSYGTYSNSNGIDAPGGSYSYNVTNCYAANGSWSDTTANSLLTGTPTSFYSNNPGTTWAKVVNNTSTPYVLSAFNSAVYDPSAVEQLSQNYTTAQGLFQPDYSYNLLSINNSDPTPSTINANNGAITFTNAQYKSTETAQVFVSKGTAPYYNSYNLNTFAYSNVCFPAKTPIQTDQGLINIDELNPEIHTIRKKKIVGITQTMTNDKYLVCFEQDCLGKNTPSQKTFISQNHEVFYKSKMMKAKDFVGSVDNVYMKKYKGEVLYNVLMEEHDKMIVNNLVCETLDPKNRIAKLYMMLQQMTPERQETFIKKFNEAQENEEEIKRNKYVSISKK